RLARHVGHGGLLRAVVPEEPVGGLEDASASSGGVTHGLSKNLLVNRFAFRSYQRKRHGTATKLPPSLPAAPTRLAGRRRRPGVMRSVLRLLAIAAIFAVTSIAWVVLGGVMTSRSGSQSSELRSRVADLWGQPQHQAGPALSFEWVTPREV